MTSRANSRAAFAGMVAGLVFAGAADAATPLPEDLVAIHQHSVDDGECQPLGAVLPYTNPIVAGLSPTQTLYALPCDLGAANPYSRLYLVTTGSRAGIRVLLFAQYDIDFGWIGDDVQFNVTYDPQTKILNAHQFFALAGDCGSEGTWAWRDYAFALVSYRFQGVCDRTHTYQTWPVIWRQPAAADAAAPRPQIGDAPSFSQGTP